MATRDEIAGFVRDQLKGRLAKSKVKELTDDVSLTNSGIIDSFGMLELVGAVEERFGLELDMDAVDFESFTTFGGFVDAVVKNG